MRFSARSVAMLGLTSVVGAGAFLWPFFLDHAVTDQQMHDLPWLFALLMGLLALVLLSQVTSRGLDAKEVAVLGVLAAAGGALRVLSAGTAGVEPMFVALILGGRVLGPSMGFLLGSLSMLTGAFLTSGVGPWLPFQMLTGGWVALGAALLPHAAGRLETWLLTAYAAVSSLAYGAVMNLWFWPFLSTSSAPTGAAFEPGASALTNAAHYGVFYVATSLGWDVGRAVVTAALVAIGSRPILRTLRRAVRRAAFAST